MIFSRCYRVNGDLEVMFRPQYHGYDKLQRLYKQANKVYYKGIQSNGMIGRLNIGKIADAVKDQINPLYKALGVD